MKVRIFDESVPVPEKEIVLRLVQKAGDIIVAVVDGNGKIVHRGQLIAFNERTMKLKRREAVSEDYDLPLNIYGRLKAEGE